MERQGKKLNTDPERARKRATTDLRCAVRKLHPRDTLRTLADTWEQEGHTIAAQELRALADRLAKGEG